jgi:hypothetical protein
VCSGFFNADLVAVADPPKQKRQSYKELWAKVGDGMKG